jgi:hypothetical protein
VSFDGTLLKRLARSRLPVGSDSVPPIELQRMGDDWIARRESAVLQVPSAVIPIENHSLMT